MSEKYIQQDFEEFLKLISPSGSMKPERIEVLREIWFASARSVFHRIMNQLMKERQGSRELLNSLNEELGQQAMEELAKRDGKDGSECLN